VSLGRFYWAGTGVVTAAGLIAGWFEPGPSHGVWLATALAVLVQAPLGWWLIRSIGKPLFMGIWAVGMGARFLTLGLFGIAVLPALDWPLMPGLVVMAALLFACLLVECSVLWVERTRIETA
jgi:hypothetical protein